MRYGVALTLIPLCCTISPQQEPKLDCKRSLGMRCVIRAGHYERICSSQDIATAILQMFLAYSLENDNIYVYIGELSCVSLGSKKVIELCSTRVCHNGSRSLYALPYQAWLYSSVVPSAKQRTH